MRIVRLASIGLCFLLALPAFAKGAQRSPTQINAVRADDGSISFQLDSPFARCVHQRTVTFTQPEAGTTFAATKSARDGSFSLELARLPAATSGFRVTVAQRGRCSADTADVAFDRASLSGGPAGGVFRGVLTSTVGACEPGRTISVYEISSDPVFVGWNLTDTSGVWTLQAAGGTYVARTGAVISGSGDSFTLCRGLFSPPWFFEEPVEES